MRSACAAWPWGSSPHVRGKPQGRRPCSRTPRLIPACAGKTSHLSSRPWCPSAHPRVCGENVPEPVNPVAAQGSSPRVRGKPAGISTGIFDRGLIPARAGKTTTGASITSPPPAHPRACGENVGGRSRADVGGLIPARAGKTISRYSRACGWGAHPRACGENSGYDLEGFLALGSSPRVRGKRCWSRGRIPRPRLIPARAGKTDLELPGVLDPGAHPRACGENQASPARGRLVAGSSPRVRGKPGHLVAGQRGERLIPARAGKTPSSSRLARPGAAHPRACGENDGRGPLKICPKGSSPRVRGKRDAGLRPRRRRGLIPARAGKTAYSSTIRARRRAHPRACGENRLRGFSRVRAWGSSPRVRGKQTKEITMSNSTRLIPARAGKTRTPLHVVRYSKAHPRACGENLRLVAQSVAVIGSSPRVRGKLGTLDSADDELGLIPARAGKTRHPRLRGR